jgi:type 1 glutamine amidotransferase
VVGGYQGDFEAGETYSGILYGERFRGILANRGQKTIIGENGKPQVVGSVGESQEIQSKIKKEDWNAYHITAKGFHFVHKINGVTTAESADEDTDKRRAKGILALQLHAGPPMKVQFRNIRLKRLDGDADANPSTKNAPKQSRAVPARNEVRKIALIAGRPSHGYAAHEHRAGCLLLAKALNESGLPVKAEVYTGGWPEDPRVLEDADTIVIYADGGGGHPFNAHLADIDRLMKRGIGLVAIHYAVEVPKGESGDAFLDWTGGYFELNWSVNPHWTANYDELPQHPIARGVKPFRVNDEWYYHMRFREELEGVTPILTDLPPKESLSRPDGGHSNNPNVRAAVVERGEPQHMAWARERPDGGRGFGFTGGHVHWNWGHNQFRKLVLNAIVWTAGLEVPKDGVSSKPLTVEELEANLDKPQPENFNRARIQALLDEWNGAGQ